MINLPRVSIIVPVYNGEKYLRRCLDSILFQTLENWECILVDDGSSDKSGEICDEYSAKDTRFRVIHKKNSGVSSARNAGLEAAQGEWIGFIDADDWIEKQTYELAVKTAEENNVELVQWNSWAVDENGNKKAFYDADVLNKGFFTLEDCCTYFHGSMWNKIVLRKLFCSTKICFDENITHCEDRIVAFKCYMAASKCYQLEDFLYNYFQRSNSALHSLTIEKVLQEKQGIETMENFISKTMQKKLQKLFTNFKCVCRSDALLGLKEPDFRLYRSIFPETTRFLLFKKRKATLIFWLAFFHLDFIAKFIIRIWRGK